MIISKVWLKVMIISKEQTMTEIICGAAFDIAMIVLLCICVVQMAKNHRTKVRTEIIGLTSVAIIKLLQEIKDDYIRSRSA